MRQVLAVLFACVAVSGRASAGTDDDGMIRPIERGVYVKASLGSTSYLHNFDDGILRPGRTLGFAVGDDFVKRDDHSVSWEIGLAQATHQGLNWQAAAAAGIPPESWVAGDVMTFAAAAGVGYTFHPFARLGIGVHGSAGTLIVPKPAELLSDMGPWPPVDDAGSAVHALVQAGPTIAYDTRLTHFSVGADLDLSDAPGFDLRFSATGYAKYTF
jgi:hypothetical protein